MWPGACVPTTRLSHVAMMMLSLVQLLWRRKEKVDINFYSKFIGDIESLLKGHVTNFNHKGTGPLLQWGYGGH